MATALIYAHAAGPDPRHTGAPGDTTCADADCHVGTPLNGGGGSVVVNFQNGLTYIPGERQTFTIVITDPKARVYGFQMTARLESDPVNGQAGDFTAGFQQLVICDNSTYKKPSGCPAKYPVEFIEHSEPFASNTIYVSWTAPSSDVGNVHIYVAANAANGNTTETGDHIYTADYVLNPVAPCTDVTPSISAVQSAGGFNSTAGLASGTWLEIYGSDLTCTSGRQWSGGDFNGSNAPTSLNNVQVTVDGIPAYVDYVSSTQVNVQAPDDPNTGAGIQIVLTNAAGSSNALNMDKNSIAPALLAPSSFNTQGHQWVVALHEDQTFVGKADLIGGLPFTPAKPGETITIYGIGFGPVDPATPAGVITPLQNSLQNAATFRFGHTAATLSYAGLAPGYVGLYQFNIVVPNVSSGDMPLNVDVGGASLNQPLYITVSQ
ncbi:MAG: IPT/TIG domain-containing protein [Acidobacteriia bacterium]|nr:IPT/TIG domain-containing protein [Terriglobia bacterium]